MMGREFDFWIGEWLGDDSLMEVFDLGNGQSGVNRLALHD